jgi:hypothetical protein
MSIADTINSFNSIIESFLLQTSPLVGTTYHHYFKKLIAYNAPIPIQHAVMHMLPFKNIINNKNESYFTEDEVVYAEKLNELDGLKEVDNTQILNEILRLKDIYYQLDDNSKDNVWSILQALVQLCIEYCDIKNIPIDDSYYH